MAGAVGVVVAFLPLRRWLGPVEATALGLGVFGWNSDLTSPELLVAMVVVIVGARLPDELRWLRVAAIVCAAWIVGSEWPFSALEYYSWLAASAVVALAAIGRTSRAAFGTVETLALLVWVPLAAYLAVPDTEEVTAIGVAFAVAVAVAWLTGQAPTAGELDAVGVAVVWAILLGGRGRWAS